MIVIPSFPFGGAERQAFELAKHKNDKINYKLVDLSSNQEERVCEGVNIYGFSIDILCFYVKNRILRRFFRYTNLIKLYFVLCKCKSDAFLFYNPIFLPLCLMLKMSGKKVFFSIREYRPSMMSGVGLFILKQMDFLYTNTPRVKDFLYKKNVSCHIVLNAVYNKHSNFSFSRKDNSILVISNVEPHKRIDFLIKAMCDSSFNIRVCGKINNIKYFEFCKRIANECNCKVEFLGAVSQEDLHKELNTCTMLIHPSSLEGTSNAVIDSLLSMTPTLVSDIQENRYLVDDLDDFVFLLDDENDLCKKINNTFTLRFERTYKDHLLYLKKRIHIKFNESNLKCLTGLLDNNFDD